MKQLAVAVILAGIVLLWPAWGAEPAGEGSLGYAVLEDIDMGFDNTDFRDGFNPSAARKPRPGDWLEYHIAFQVDPLENRLRLNPAPSHRDSADSALNGSESVGGDMDLFPILPMFEPDTAWRIVPIRLEIREVDADGCHAEVIYSGGREQTYLGGTTTEAATEFRYDGPGDAEVHPPTQTVTLGDSSFDVEVMRREGIAYGFERWFNAELPFGIYRFATPHVDMALVGMGVVPAPDFPLSVQTPVVPPLGMLYEKSME